jgi:nucleotide-binding universal stress UspA family protein
MFKHMLMPTDGAEHSEKAVRRGVELAQLCGARITGIHVIPDHRMLIGSAEIMSGRFDADMGDYVGNHVRERAREHAARFLAFVQTTADAAGVPCKTFIATSQRVYDAIVDTADERGCDLIVMTARCRTGLASLVAGSEASRVLHRSSIPVLTFRTLMSANHYN